MQLQQLTGVTEKCLIQHATSTFACPLCEFRVTKVKNLFITTVLFSRNTKFHEKLHVKQPTQGNRKYYKHRHEIWICSWYAFTFLVSMYKCVHNFQSILCTLVDWRAIKLYSGSSPNRILTGTLHIPTEFVCGFSSCSTKLPGYYLN